MSVKAHTDDDGLLVLADPAAYSVACPEGRSRFFFTCDHAGCALPARLGTLGLPEPELKRHIAWDLGVAGLARRLSARLDAFLILQTYSRLVIDVNRPPNTPESIVTESEHTHIPGNQGLSPGEKDARAEAVFWPYHGRIRRELDRRIEAGQLPVLVALHSFTPVFKAVHRPWQIGVLYGRDARLGRALLGQLRHHPELSVGDNEPYAVSDETDYTLLVHGEQRGLLHVELEIRQDLLADEHGQESWATRLADLLERIEPALFLA